VFWQRKGVLCHPKQHGTKKSLEVPCPLENETVYICLSYFSHSNSWCPIQVSSPLGSLPLQASGKANIANDPEAAARVFAAGFKAHVAGLDVTMATWLGPQSCQHFFPLC
jgi:hypothetical protein